MKFDIDKRYLYKLLVLMMLVIIVAFASPMILNIFYDEPIGKVISVSPEQMDVDALSPYEDHEQTLTLELLNTDSKGEQITITQRFTVSQAFSDVYRKEDEVLLRHDQDRYYILTLKRDHQILTLLLMFVMLTIVIGGKKGAKSLLSVLLNFAVVAVMMAYYLNGGSIYVITPVSAVIFIFTSMTLVTGFNKKTLAASIGTASGSLIAIVIAYVVFHYTDNYGLNYQEMDISIKSPVELFYLQLVIGTLGAIMDIAVSIASSIEELIQTSPHISMKNLFKSGRVIGQDTMGTMTNTLMLAYLSGGIPLLLIMIKGGVTLNYLINVSLSLELMRAVIGSIGIVATIPITLLVSMKLLHGRGKQVNA